MDVLRAGPLLTLLGCAAPAPEEEPDPPEDTAAMTWSTEEPEPLLDAAAVEAILDGVAALGAPNGYDITMTWLNRMNSGDPDCPGNGMFLDMPAEGCTAFTGAYYAGIGWYEVTEAEAGAEGELVELSFYHGGDFMILGADATRFAGGGELRSTTTTEDTTRAVALHMEGTWEDEAQSGWLGAGFSAVYEGEVVLDPEGISVEITGGLGVGEADLFLDELGWSDHGDCPGQLTGAISVRDERGYWTVWDMADRCDGCGTLTFHDDVALGELCLDLAPWGEALAMLNAPR